MSKTGPPLLRRATQRSTTDPASTSTGPDPGKAVSADTKGRRDASSLVLSAANGQNRRLRALLDRFEIGSLACRRLMSSSPSGSIIRCWALPLLRRISRPGADWPSEYRGGERVHQTVRRPARHETTPGYSGVAVGTTIGFPHGGHSTAVKVFEARGAMEDGATELDMVVNLGACSAGLGRRRDDIAPVNTGPLRRAILKVIFENCNLNDNQKTQLCEIFAELGLTM